MAKPLVSDELWERVEPLLPPTDCVDPRVDDHRSATAKY